MRMDKHKGRKIYYISKNNITEQIKAESFDLFITEVSRFKTWLMTAIFHPSPEERYGVITMPLRNVAVNLQRWLYITYIL